MKDLCTKKELSSTAESEFHVRLWVWGGGKRGKDNGDFLITHRSSQSADENHKVLDWGSRGILAEETQYLGHLCAVWCEGISSRSWQHWHPFLRPLGESHLGSVLTSFAAELQCPASSPGS